MDQDDTYRKLVRIPLNEMEALLDIKNFTPMGAPVFSWNDSTYEVGTYWKRELDLHRWRVQQLDSNGWTFEDFFKEVEKRNIQNLVNDFNARNSVPPGLLARIQEFFPNARLEPAKLELE